MQKTQSVFGSTSTINSVCTQYAPFILRISLGLIFLLHGYEKISDLTATTQSFLRMGIAFPVVTAPLVALVEFGGGVALIAGLGSRVFALLLVATMLVAIVAVRMSAGFMGGWELEWSLTAGLLAVLLSGPGALSISRNKQAWYA